MTKKADTWMPIYVGDYLAMTSHLNAEQHGAYLLLLLHGWKHGGRLPAGDTQLAQITRMSSRQWKDSRVVVMEFFDKDDIGYTQKRQMEEIAKAGKMVAAKSQAGKLGAEIRWQTHSRGIGKDDGEMETECMANASQVDAPSPSHTPSQRTKTRANQKTKSEPPLAFAPPDWVPRQEWDDFDEMRRRKSGKSWTLRAQELAVGELQKLVDLGESAGSVLQQSVYKSWAGLFPVKVNGQTRNGNGRLSDAGMKTAEAGQRWIEQEEAKDAARGA